MSRLKQVCMDRAISPNEVKVVQWLLDHALGDVRAYRLHPVEDLRVVEGCSCGCSSLYFSSKRGSLQRLADEVALYPDGQTAGLMLWGRDGEIVWLEVYDFEPESSHRRPDVSHLCTWEDWGRRDLGHANQEQ